MAFNQLMALLNSQPAQEEREILGLNKNQQARSLEGLLNVFKQPKNELEQMVEVSMPDVVKQKVLERFNDPLVAASILGNISHETGGSFDPDQEQYGGGPGRGLFQMEGKMLDAYNQYLQGQDNTVDTQLDFFNKVLQGDDIYDIGAGHRQRIQEAFGSGDLNRMNNQLMESFFRSGKPQMDKRQKAINQFLEILTGE